MTADVTKQVVRLAQLRRSSTWFFPGETCPEVRAQVAPPSTLFRIDSLVAV
jgi:hypothetical protein